MQPCEHSASQIAFFLDGELQPAEQQALTAHLADCAACRQRLAEEETFVQTVRQAAPLHVAPAALRARVASLLHQAQTEKRPALASASLRQRVTKVLETSWHEHLAQTPGAATPGRATADRHTAASPTQGWFGLSWLRLASVGLAALFLVSLAVSDVTRREQFSGLTELARLAPDRQLARVAVDAHLRFLRGQLPLEIANDSPASVSQWFVNKVAFKLDLPEAFAASGLPAEYQVAGARLLGFNHDYAAFVAYRVQGKPVSLVVIPASAARVSTAAPNDGSEMVQTHKLSFHSELLNGQKVITWTDQGLTYALVSDFAARAQQSCLICHTTPQGRALIDEFQRATVVH